MSRCLSPAPFVYATWAARYPEFNGVVAPSLASLYYAEALKYAGRAQADTVIVYALTAHVAAINAPVDEGEANNLVGRISSASQGSVSVSTDLDTPQAAAFFAQTKYGLSAWQMMAPYRVARFYPRSRQRSWC